MRPIPFPEQNRIFAENQPEYQPLPAHIVNEPGGRVISCWKLSFRERLKILITGKMWSSLMSFNKPLTPSLFSVDKRDFFYTKKQLKKMEKTN
jgi:hypothetical protein